jgi:hypothetical protein
MHIKTIILEAALILLACASHALAGQTVYVTITAAGEGSDLIVQAYTDCLRNTPGVQVLPSGQPSDALIEIASVITRNQARTQTGYAWACCTLNAVTFVLLSGPTVDIAGSHQEILQQAASDVQILNRSVFTNFRPSPTAPDH